MGDIITDNVKKYFNIGNTILLLGILIAQVRWQTQVDSRLVALELHANDKVVHMPLSDKIVLFVPRVELDSRLSGIEDGIKELSKDIKDTLNK